MRLMITVSHDIYVYSALVISRCIRVVSHASCMQYVRWSRAFEVRGAFCV